MHPELMQKEHDRCHQEAIQLFQCIRKMGGEEKSRIYLEQLEREITEMYRNYSSHNSAKSFYASFQTPLTLVVLLVALIIISKLSDLIGLESIVSLLNFGVMTVLASLVAWGYTRMTGKFPEVGSSIDGAALFIQQVRI